MVSRKDIGSWLTGSTTTPAGGRLDLPEQGPGARAGLARRIGALFVDWFVCWLVNYLVFAVPAGEGIGRADGMITLAVFAVENLLLVATLGFTIGHRLFGIRVRPLAGRAVGLRRALVRTVLLCLVIPAVVWDGDGRGLHDRAAGTVIVRM